MSRFLRISLCSAVLFMQAFSMLWGQSEPDHPDPASWLELNHGYFHYIYQAQDKAFVDTLCGMDARVQDAVRGFWGYVPPAPVKVVIRGNNSALGWAGYFSPLPFRIVLNTAASMDPYELFVHEFTHYSQASVPQGALYGLSWIFGTDIRAANLPLAPHSLEGSTTFMEGGKAAPLSLLPLKALMYGERTWTWDDFWWSGWFFPWNYRVYIGSYLFQEALYEQFGPDTFQKIWDWQTSHLCTEEDAIRQVTGWDPRQIWTHKVQALRKTWSTNFARPDGRAVLPGNSMEQRQIFSFKPMGDGRCLILTSTTSRARCFAILEADGSLKPLEGIRGDVGSTDWDLSADGRFLVMTVTSTNSGSLETECSQSRLLWYRLDSQGRVTGEGGGTVRSAQGEVQDIAAPCLSPDALRLVLTSRHSDHFRLGEVDLKTLVYSEITSLPDCRSAVWSPEGSSLALELYFQGQSDIALWQLPPSGTGAGKLIRITQDKALDSWPRFGLQGELLFTSDRQNELAVYSFQEGKIRRFLSDPVGAWAPGFGWGRPDQLVYQSMTADGYVLKIAETATWFGAERAGGIPGESWTPEQFAALEPDYVGVKNKRRELYESLGHASGVEVPSQAHVSALVDLPLPRVWYPKASYDNRGLGAGAAVMAYSLLGGSDLSIQASWFPQDGQAEGSLDLGLNLPGCETDIMAGYTWGLGANAQGEELYTYQASLGLSLVADWGTWKDSRGSVSMESSLSTWWVRYSQNLESLPLNQIADTAWFEYGKIQGSTTLAWNGDSAAAQVFGSSGLSARLKGMGIFTQDTAKAAAGLQTQGYLDLGSGVLLGLGGEGDAGWGSNPFELVDSWSAAWDQPVSAALAFRGQLSLHLPLGLYEGKFAVLASDRSGLGLGLASQWYSTDWQSLTWDPNLECMLWFVEGTRFLYASLPIRIQIGYQLDMDSSTFGFDPSRLCFGLRFYTVDLASPGIASEVMNGR